jgi:nicotinamidase-related amidase
VTLGDFETGKWTPRNPNHKDHCQQYLKELKLKEMSLTIKPEHCLKGSLGHTVVPAINEAIQEWAGQRKSKVGYLFKSENCLTDMTSIFAADVKIIGDPTTTLDAAFMRHLHTAEKLIVCGQSLSHGIRYSMRDLLLNWQKETSKILLLRDGSSPNPNIDPGKFQPENFWGEMSASGVTVIRSAEVFVDL